MLKLVIFTSFVKKYNAVKKYYTSYNLKPWAMIQKQLKKLLLWVIRDTKDQKTT